MGTVQLSPPAAPFSRIKNPGGAITINTAGKVLVIPTGDSAKLPSFNEYTLNSNRLTIAESPFGGMKGAGAADYGVGTVSTATTGINITDLAGTNGAQVFPTGKLKELNLLAVDSSAKTITEEFIIENTNIENSVSPTVIDNCDDAATKGAFSFGTGTITVSTTEKVYGTGSFYFNGTATADAGTLLGTIQNVDVDIGTNQFFSFWVKSSHTGRFRFTARTSNGYYSWTSLITTAGSWQHFVLSIAACSNKSGTSTTITYLEVGYFTEASLKGVACNFYVDRVTMDVAKRAVIEVRVPDRLGPAGITVSSYSASVYSEVGKYYLDSGYSILSSTPANLKFLNGSAFDTVYGSGNGRALYSRAGPGGSGIGASGNITYSENKGTASRIGFYFDFSPNDSFSFSKLQLKLLVNYADETTGGLAALSNASSALNIPTYDGSNQPVHPSILYFVDGWHGYKYWMAMTPYPNGNDNYENPSIVASNDKVTWEVPVGLTNPIYSEPVAGHNNDTTLVYDSVADKLLCYWLDCRRAAECAGYEAEDWYNHQYLMMSESSDGITWSTAIPSIDWNLGTGDWFVISPVVIKLSSTLWRLYYIKESDRTLHYHESTDGLNWGAASGNIFTFPNMWHIDIKYIPEVNEYWGIYCLYGAGADLYFIKSTDGISWTQFNRKLILHSYTTGAWDITMYRPTLNYLAASDTIEIWYSAYNPTTAARHIGYKSISRSSLMSLLLVSPEKYGATSYDFDDSTNASYGLQNLSKPWIALYDPAKSLIDFYLFTHRPKALTRRRNDSGEIYELVLYPGNGAIYHGQVTNADLTTDSNANLIPNCLESSIDGSVTKFLAGYSAIVEPSSIEFITTGQTFAPVITTTGSPSILWTFSDGTTDTTGTPSKDFGTAAIRKHTLKVTPWTGLQYINVGYNGDDDGETPGQGTNLTAVTQQNVSAILNLQLATQLKKIACSRNPITFLDVSGLAALTTIEAYAASSMANITLKNNTSLSRLCAESCHLSTLDLSECLALGDLRTALQGTGSININWAESNYSSLYHVCVRDQVNAACPPFAQMPALQILYIWNSGLSGTLDLSLNTGLYSVIASYNSFTNIILPSNLSIIVSMLFNNNSLNQATVDAILETCDSSGLSGKTINLSSNAAPSAAGIAHKDNLVSKGWTVTTD